MERSSPWLQHPSKLAPYVVYKRDLGWFEYDQDGDSVPACIVVVEANIGFNIFRIGQSLQFIEWFYYREDALDYSCDLSRQDIAEHEIRQSERDS